MRSSIARVAVGVAAAAGLVSLSTATADASGSAPASSSAPAPAPASAPASVKPGATKVSAAQAAKIAAANKARNRLAARAAATGADLPYTPSDADFAKCPALPAKARPETWNCFAITAVGGTMNLGSISQDLTAPIRITVAQGKLTDNSVVALYGDISGDPMKVPGGLLGAPLEIPPLTDVSVQTSGTGMVKPGALFPQTMGIKIRLIHWLLGDSCYIGSDANPISLTPELQSMHLDTIDGVPVIRANGVDNSFTVPGASGCGLNWGLINTAVNIRAGLPSPTGKNSATLHLIVRLKTY